MNKETLEHLSSLVDGELSRETGLFLTRRLSSDEELGMTWARYHMIRDCLRQPGGKLAVSDMSLQVQGLMTQEPESKTVSPKASRWIKPVAGFAIVASVAVVAILVTTPGLVPENGGPDVEPFTSPNKLSSLPISQPASFNANTRAGSQRLNSYLLRHKQVAGAVGRQGFVSFVPIVATPPAEPANELEAQSGETAADNKENAEPSRP